MEVKNWDVRERFLFPQSFGIPKRIKNVEVTPQYEQKDTEDVRKITGIYHIACHVEFEEGEHAHHATSEFTEIEDLDVQGEIGYFEYAVPMSVEISNSKIQPGSSPTLNVHDVDSKTTENAAIEITWSVKCEYETPKVEVQKVKEIEEVLEVLEALEEVFEEAQEELEEILEEVLEETQEEMQVVQKGQDIKIVEKLESTNLKTPELAFIYNLEDGYSKVSFPSNNILVEQKTKED